ncbi:hypothetical protein TNCV_4852501 [Trichonephila clavipes]|nr:hypothetical protein TNCV_4852501 [Trichonephila clavipes]
MSSPGFEPRSNGTAVSVANHLAGWATWRNMSETEISPRVGRNCNANLALLDAGRNDGRRDHSHSPRCTTVRDNKWIVRMAVIDRTATSETIVQQIQSVTHNSEQSHNNRHHFHQSIMSARHPLLHILLTGNNRHLQRQQNGME